MRRYIRVIICLLCIMSIMVVAGCNKQGTSCNGSTVINPLDHINEYEIRIDPREDGTLDMHFKIEWTVLNSTTEGPLEWVRIGVPNCYVDEIKKETSNIDKIKYDSDNGSFIRIDFDREYHKGETLVFAFSTHQSRIYNLNGDYCEYGYNPGWFPEIQVTEARVLWRKDNVIYSNSERVEGDYLVWDGFLDFNETIQVNVQYEQSNFINLSEDKQYSNNYMTVSDIVILVIVGLLILSIVALLVYNAIKKHDPYMSARGYYGRSYYHPYFFIGRSRSGYSRSGARIVNPGSGGHGGRGGGGSCACACACACAGGGRAGCSKKDFYNTNLNSQTLIKVLSDEEKIENI